MSDLNDDLPVQDELTTLKARADALGISYHPSIGVEKLREKVNAALAPKEEATPAADEKAPAAETPGARRLRLRNEAMKLVRIRLTCMNPNKKEWDGEFITAGNSTVGSITKYVPFNADEGWHVPHIIYEQLRDRECQTFVTVRDSKGNATRKGKLIKEFAIELLPPLTPEELKDLAQRQAMSKSVG